VRGKAQPHKRGRRIVDLTVFPTRSCWAAYTDHQTQEYPQAQKGSRQGKAIATRQSCFRREQAQTGRRLRYRERRQSRLGRGSPPCPAQQIRQPVHNDRRGLSRGTSGSTPRLRNPRSSPDTATTSITMSCPGSAVRGCSSTTRCDLHSSTVTRPSTAAATVGPCQRHVFGTVSPIGP
jgi:hypothetical protein